jgi:DNA-directed RNA polymerase subunit F
MNKPQIIEEIPLNIVEVKEMLKKIKERDQELNFRAQKTAEYLDAISTIKPKQAKEMKEKLLALNVPRFRDMHVHKIIDIMPKTPEGVKTIFSGLNISITADNIKKIVDIVNEYSDTKKKTEEKEE